MPDRSHIAKTPGRPFLPFHPQFYGAVADGSKTKTCRTKRYGYAGDILETPVGLVRLVNVERTTLGVVARDHWREEGETSPEGFRSVWMSLHPIRRWTPHRKVFLHTFEVVQP